MWSVSLLATVTALAAFAPATLKIPQEFADRPSMLYVTLYVPPKAFRRTGQRPWPRSSPTQLVEGAKPSSEALLGRRAGAEIPPSGAPADEDHFHTSTALQAPPLPAPPITLLLPPPPNAAPTVCGEAEVHESAFAAPPKLPETLYSFDFDPKSKRGLKGRPVIATKRTRPASAELHDVLFVA